MVCVCKSQLLRKLRQEDYSSPGVPHRLGQHRKLPLGKTEKNGIEMWHPGEAMGPPEVRQVLTQELRAMRNDIQGP